jgi:hypothetical protein
MIIRIEINEAVGKKLPHPSMLDCCRLEDRQLKNRPGSGRGKRAHQNQDNIDRDAQQHQITQRPGKSWKTELEIARPAHIISRWA